MKFRSLVLPVLALLLVATPVRAETSIPPAVAQVAPATASAPETAAPAAAEAAPKAAPAPETAAPSAAEATPAAAPTPEAASPSAADVAPPTLSESATSVASVAANLALAARGDGTRPLTWGQDMAAQDLERLALAAKAFDTAANSKDEVSFEQGQRLVTEMETAAARVRNTFSISVLDVTEQQQAQALVAGVQGMADAFAVARRAAQREVAARANRPRFGFSIGIGNGYGNGFGGPYWGGYPGWGWGYPVNYGWGHTRRHCR